LPIKIEVASVGEPTVLIGEYYDMILKYYKKIANFFALTLVLTASILIAVDSWITPKR
jgi:hypothetical protein